MKLSARDLVFDVTVGGSARDRHAPVLLLHGFPQNASEWDRVAPALHADGRATIAPDQRGYSPGARPADVADYRMVECVADIVAMLDGLDANKVDVVGHDWGALVAWHLAAEHPDRVRTLTAISVAHPAAMSDAIAIDPDQQQRSAYIKLFRQPGKAEDVLLENNGARLRAMFGGCPSELVDGYVAPMLDRAALTAALNWYRAMSRDTPECPPVTVPTTFVWGDGDIAIGPTAAKACANHVTGDYAFVPLTGVSHWVADEVPDILAEIILERLRRPAD
ncbi:MAG TPA: alpha/beta hydrolase [Micromonosporaceae bacterium]|nr:alpha/beta hydrolase [Micromonosporaceae bacterium]